MEILIWIVKIIVVIFCVGSVAMLAVCAVGPMIIDIMEEQAKNKNIHNNESPPP